ncbi:hypothetical protein [Streptomyces platensis]|uniref:hypothetical protein n=1 Tax=Streptomyces platensis TaxID=58346 RepID=UPI001F1D4BAC|nr:hypothetical protein [Streptomyces platensis]MCF3142631.1 hypothetical protein [Streptomyces platensis]
MQGATVLRRFRTPLLALMVILTFLLGSTADPDMDRATFSGVPVSKSASALPAVKPSYDTTEEKSKRAAERGQPRRVRTATGVPHHTGRPLPPLSGIAAPHTLPASGHPTAGSTTKAAPKPVEIPLLHCVFRC